MEITTEFEGAEFGDERLNRRLVWMSGHVADDPSASFPEAAGGDAQLEATYRFLGNERVTPEAILAPHVRQTIRRATEVASPLVVAHDTTEFNFGSSPRKDLGRVGLGKSFGFYGHFALAVAVAERPRPLGLVGIRVHRRRGDKGKRTAAQLRDAEDNEGRRWGQLVEDVEDTVDDLGVVHVMDREADSYALMSTMIEKSHRFVIRMASAKRKLVGEFANEELLDVLAGAETVAERAVPLSHRGVSKMPSYRKHHPARKARVAKLHISAQTLTLRRPVSIGEYPNQLTVNVVRVHEPHPPADEEAIEWRLWTNEPINAPEEVLAIVDAYRCRWVIEEFFRALKEGCRFESRQLESMHGLLNVLALFAPIAWRLLALRTAARDDTPVETGPLLNDAQLRCLSFALARQKRPPLPSHPTARDVLLGVAALGGHIKNNGDPGWIVLGRGLEKLLTIELGYLAARAEM